MNILISIRDVKKIFEDLGFDNYEEITEQTYIIGKKSDFSSIEVVGFFFS